MKFIKLIKMNKLLTIVLIGYLCLLLTSPSIAIKSGENSIYYIKEMLIIMPVIFVLSSLIETWIPRELILNSFGKNSGIKGLVFSFALGSLSAGPIYAAFPVCKTLVKKGASIFNIVIILSSWAVIKVPMLINETKFLGINFMIARWILTIISIVIMASLVNSTVKPKDLPMSQSTEEITGLTVNSHYCIGCGICAREFPEYFEIEAGKAHVIFSSTFDDHKLLSIIRKCPTKAISLTETSA